jgi:site-specific recombinase XerD
MGKMDDRIPEFLKRLYDEIIHHKEKRANFVVQKFISITALFGLAFGKIGDLDLTLALFAVPIVSVALDVFISAEDYKVKRVGTFLRIYRFASDPERNWERFINQHRESLAETASLLLTILASVSSAGILLYQNIYKVRTNGEMLFPYWFYFSWLLLVISLIIFIVLFYKKLKKSLPKPHLAEHQARDLLEAPSEDSESQLLDKLMIALILNTGVTKKELLSVEWSDLDYSYQNNKALRIKGIQKTCERIVPYRNENEIEAIIRKLNPSSQTVRGFLFLNHISKSYRPRPEKIDKILEKYPIVVDGAIQTIKADELRVTYARYLYDEGDSLNMIQTKLGCSDIKDVLGFVGPLEILREERRKNTKDQE